MEVRHLFHLDVVELHVNAHSCSARMIVDKNKLAFLAFRYVYRKRGLLVFFLSFDEALNVVD
jgi:hypothetical protein